MPLTTAKMIRAMLEDWTAEGRISDLVVVIGGVEVLRFGRES